MPHLNSQTFLARKRPPRVQIEYEVELYGAEKNIQLPFVVGVMADLSGKPEEPLLPVYDRKFLEIDADNFDERLKAMKPRVAFRVSNTLTGAGELLVDIIFENMDDFSPAAVAQKVKPLNILLSLRTQLSNLLAYIDGKPALADLITKALHDPTLLQSLASALRRENGASQEAKPAEAESQARCQSEGDNTDVSEFVSLLRKEVEPRSDRTQKAIELAIGTLAEAVLSNSDLVCEVPDKTIEAIIAEFDFQLTRQVNLIMHYEEFLTLESAWRGLRYLVDNTETDEMLKIRVMNISKKELGKTLKKFKGIAWDQSPMFKKLYEEEYGTFGGEPYGCLIGDYHFDHSPSDVELLGEIAIISAVSYTPFISGVAPSVLNMESWSELANPRDLTKIFQTPDYAAWRSLRESEDSNYLALALPSFLGRLPYGAKTVSVMEFDFEEDQGADRSLYCWVNSAYALAVNITRAFKLYGWCARILGFESGGAIEDLLVHMFPTDDGGIDTIGPTEITVTDRRALELARIGFMAFMQRKNTHIAAFIEAKSLHEPALYDDPDATRNAELSTRLPYILATCRFAHYLKCITRDKRYLFKDRTHGEAWLNQWINRYVEPDPLATELQKARRPLAGAEIVLEEVGENAGYYRAKFYLHPRYQLEGLTASQCLISMLPSPLIT